MSPADGEGESEPFEWECQQCGKTTPKNDTPCSRCGAIEYEKVPLHRDEDLAATESLIPTSRRALIGYGGAVALVAIGGGYTILSGTTPPSIENVPGHAQSASGIEFAVAEAAVRETVNNQRDDPLQHDSTVDDAATYYTKSLVKGGTSSEDLTNALEKFGLSEWYAARNRFTWSGGRAIDYYDSASALGQDLAESWLNDEAIRPNLLDSAYTRTGVDIHVAENGDIYITQIVD